MQDDNLPAAPAGTQQAEAITDGASEAVPDDTLVVEYPEDVDDADPWEAEADALVQAAMSQQAATPTANGPIGYVSNARNASSQSDTMLFWAPAETTIIGIGSLVRHAASAAQGQPPVETFAIITSAEAHTLGLDDFATHVYEEDAQPPLTSITPAPSRRRPVVSYKARVVASKQSTLRPVLSGPIYNVDAAQLAEVHGMEPHPWPGPSHMLLGFYEDGDGNFGIFAEQRARVLGPQQGHVILSGVPGAGKTSLYLTTVIALFAQLRNLEQAAANGQEGENNADE